MTKRKLKHHPTDIDSLEQLIRKVNRPCTCREHKPEAYTKPSREFVCSKFDKHAWYPQLSRDPKLIKGHRYEAFHLVECAIASFSRCETDLSDIQKQGLSDFRGAGQTRLRLGWKDGGRALAASEVQKIFECFNKIFFFGAVQAKVTWRVLPKNRLGRYGDGEIEIDPINCDCDDMESVDCEDRRVNRLDTILHEGMHAFLDQLGCHYCPTFDENVENASGHGRAWQMLHASLGDATERLLEVRLDEGGLCDILYNWDGVKYTPSLHDLEICKGVWQESTSQSPVQL